MDSRNDLSDFFDDGPSQDDGNSDGSQVEVKYLYVRIRRVFAAPTASREQPTLIGAPASPRRLNYQNDARIAPKEWRVALAVGAVVIALLLAVIGAFQFMKSHAPQGREPPPRAERDTPRLWIELGPGGNR